MTPFRSATCIAAALLAITFSIAPASAQESLADLPSFRSGCQALQDDRFETATEHFESTWESLKESGAGDIERDFVASRLLQSLVKNGETSTAVSWLDENSVNAPSPDTLKWSAVALQSEGRFAEAAVAYQGIISQQDQPAAYLALHYATCLALSNRADEALKYVTETEISPASASEFLDAARIASLADRPDLALSFLNQSSDSSELPTSLILPLARLQVRTLTRLNRKEEAIEIAVQLIENASSQTLAEHGFFLLEEIGIQTDDTVLQERIIGLQMDPSHPSAVAASFYAKLFFSEPTELTDLLESIATEDPPGPFALEARLRLQEADLSGKSDWSSELPDNFHLPCEPDREHFINNISAYRREEFALAAKQFTKKAAKQSGENRFRSFFNAGLASLQGGDFDGFTQAFEQLNHANPNSSYLADLKYLGGLYLASEGDPNALQHLQTFIREHPEHSSHVEALLALAEIHINQVPARPQAAREIFKDLRVRPLTLGQSERLDYTSVWVELIDDNDPAMVRVAEAFVRDWPRSNYLPEIGVLLGSQQYRNKNPKSARRIFLKVAKQFPNSKYAETARFFAAKSAPRGESAIEEWEELVSSGSEIAPQAHHELSLLLLSMNQFEEARSQLKSIIETSGEDESLRYAAMADVGFAYYIEALAKNHNEEILNKAASAFAQLSNLPNAPVTWRYNAAVRRAKCLEALGRDSVALEVYRSMITEESNASNILREKPSVLENEWIFRAGLSAIRILTKNEDWAGAIKIADTLSLKEGPRAIEASRLAENLRLKHWVWD
tara:strand:+ start:4429 stop:6801 length:2373 start_codon:yes stop_codon:yes gene_type:complete